MSLRLPQFNPAPTLKLLHREEEILAAAGHRRSQPTTAWYTHKHTVIEPVGLAAGCTTNNQDHNTKPAHKHVLQTASGACSARRWIPTHRPSVAFADSRPGKPDSRSGETEILASCAGR